MNIVGKAESGQVQKAFKEIKMTRTQAKDIAAQIKSLPLNKPTKIVLPDGMAATITRTGKNTFKSTIPTKMSLKERFENFQKTEKYKTEFKPALKKLYEQKMKEWGHLSETMIEDFEFEVWKGATLEEAESALRPFARKTRLDQTKFKALAEISGKKGELTSGDVRTYVKKAGKGESLEMTSFRTRTEDFCQRLRDGQHHLTDGDVRLIMGLSARKKDPACAKMLKDIHNARDAGQKKIEARLFGMISPKMAFSAYKNGHMFVEKKGNQWKLVMLRMAPKYDTLRREYSFAGTLAGSLISAYDAKYAKSAVNQRLGQVRRAGNISEPTKLEFTVTDEFAKDFDQVVRQGAMKVKKEIEAKEEEVRFRGPGSLASTNLEMKKEYNNFLSKLGAKGVQTHEQYMEAMELLWGMRSRISTYEMYTERPGTSGDYSYGELVAGRNAQMQNFMALKRLAHGYISRQNNFIKTSEKFFDQQLDIDASMYSLLKDVPEEVRNSKEGQEQLAKLKAELAKDFHAKTQEYVDKIGDPKSGDTKLRDKINDKIAKYGLKNMELKAVAYLHKSEEGGMPSSEYYRFFIVGGKSKDGDYVYLSFTGKEVVVHKEENKSEAFKDFLDYSDSHMPTGQIAYRAEDGTTKTYKWSTKTKETVAKVLGALGGVLMVTSIATKGATAGPALVLKGISAAIMSGMLLYYLGSSIYNIVDDIDHGVFKAASLIEPLGTLIMISPAGKVVKLLGFLGITGNAAVKLDQYIQSIKANKNLSDPEKKIALWRAIGELTISTAMMAYALRGDRMGLKNYMTKMKNKILINGKKLSPTNIKNYANKLTQMAKSKKYRKLMEQGKMRLPVELASGKKVKVKGFGEVAYKQTIKFGVPGKAPTVTGVTKFKQTSGVQLSGKNTPIRLQKVVNGFQKKIGGKNLKQVQNSRTYQRAHNTLKKLGIQSEVNRNKILFGENISGTHNGRHFTFIADKALASSGAPKGIAVHTHPGDISKIMPSAEDFKVPGPEYNLPQGTKVLVYRGGKWRPHNLKVGVKGKVVAIADAKGNVNYWIGKSGGWKAKIVSWVKGKPVFRESRQEECTRQYQKLVKDYTIDGKKNPSKAAREKLRSDGYTFMEIQAAGKGLRYTPSGKVSKYSAYDRNDVYQKLTRKWTWANPDLVNHVINYCEARGLNPRRLVLGKSGKLFYQRVLRGGTQWAELAFDARAAAPVSFSWVPVKAPF